MIVQIDLAERQDYINCVIWTAAYGDNLAL